MRLISKYKNFILSNKILISCPLKILKFHRTKWKKVQKLIKNSKKNLFFKKKYKLKNSYLFFKKTSFLISLKKSSQKKKSTKRFKNKKILFVNNLKAKIFFKRWLKLKKKYSESLKLKRLACQIFDNSIKNKFFKREIKKNNELKFFSRQFILLFIKPLFKINILLTKLFFFKSIYNANQILDNKRVLLNGNYAKPNQFAKKGDIITFSDLSFNHYFKIISSLQSSSFFSFFYNFIEIDHYSKTIIIIKDYNSLSNQDINLIYKKYLNLKYFIDYFK